jgi:hypothetical protein
MGHLTRKLAAGVSCEQLREVAQLLAQSDGEAAEAFAAVREARDAASHADGASVEPLPEKAKQHATAAHVGADRAMEIPP